MRRLQGAKIHQYHPGKLPDLSGIPGTVTEIDQSRAEVDLDGTVLTIGAYSTGGKSPGGFFMQTVDPGKPGRLAPNMLALAAWAQAKGATPMRVKGSPAILAALLRGVAKARAVSSPPGKDEVVIDA